MSRPLGTAEELERRRRRAVELVEVGEERATVARVLGVHPKTLARWLRQARKPGGLAARPAPGRPPGLNDLQLGQLEQLLLDGPRAHGWKNALWTAPRVARLIERFFGVTYHPEHVRRLLKRRLDWSSQKPRRKARERDDKEVERWLGDEFPRIAREAYRRGAYLAFWDESGFFLTPTVRRTLAPRGRTPVLEAWDRRDRLSAISCVSVSPARGRLNLHFRLLEHNVRAQDVVDTLRALHRTLGPVTVVWDRNQIHSRSRLVRAWLAGHPGVVVEDFPAYAPDLNPDEGVWGWAKYGRLPNLAAHDTDELYESAWIELDELKHRPDLLRGIIRQTGLPGILRAG